MRSHFPRSWPALYQSPSLTRRGSKYCSKYCGWLVALVQVRHACNVRRALQASNACSLLMEAADQRLGCSDTQQMRVAVGRCHAATACEAWGCLLARAHMQVWTWRRSGHLHQPDSRTRACWGGGANDHALLAARPRAGCGEGYWSDIHSQAAAHPLQGSAGVTCKPESRPCCGVDLTADLMPFCRRITCAVDIPRCRSLAGMSSWGRVRGPSGRLVS
jgi:hypothetical protein